MDRLTHRATMRGLRPVCGTKAMARVSHNGVGVTCPKCLEIERPLTREEAMKQIEAAAAKRVVRT